MVYIPLEQANKGFQVLFNLPNAAHQEMHGKEGQEATAFLSQLIYWPCILSLLLAWSLQELFSLMEQHLSACSDKHRAGQVQDHQVKDTRK